MNASMGPSSDCHGLNSAISIGAASCPTDAIRLDELLRHAMSQRKAAH